MIPVYDFPEYDRKTGVPAYWRQDVSGVLPAAMNAYLDHILQGAPISAEQITLVISFLVYFIEAPCWNHMSENPAMGADLTRLRERAKQLKTTEDISSWINSCTDVAIDPI